MKIIIYENEARAQEEVDWKGFRFCRLIDLPCKKHKYQRSNLPERLK